MWAERDATPEIAYADHDEVYEFEREIAAKAGVQTESVLLDDRSLKNIHFDILFIPV